MKQERAKTPSDPGDASVIDHVADETAGDVAEEGSVKPPTTDTGLPVEEQVRKEWEPGKGGLPNF